MDVDTQRLLPLLIPVLILAIIIRRGLRDRKVKVERLWVLPALLLLVAGSSLYAAPPKHVLAAGVEALALALGAAAGWWRGRLTNITINPETHELTSRTSPFGVLLIAGLFLVRFGLRYEAQTNPGVIPGGAGLVTEALLVLAIGMMATQRLEMWLRCQRLLAEARANGPRKP